MNVLRFLFGVFSIILIGGGITGCQKDDFQAQFVSTGDIFVRDTATRTVLVYMAAKNSLWSYHDENINQMKEALSLSGLRDCHVVIYSSQMNANPKLLEMVWSGDRVDTITVKNYPFQNSVDKSTMQQVLADVKRFFPAKENGLILWSHGLNWLPAHLVYNDGPASVAFSTIDSTDGIRLNSFGVENGRQMELNELRDVLPDKGYRFILFDACLMGSVEVAYALRNKADFLIASPAEIWIAGFPYRKIMQEFVAPTVDLERVCETFYEHYNSKSGLERTGAVALIDLKQMEPLSDLVGQIYRNGRARMDTVDWRGVQQYDRGHYHTAFDLDDYMARISSPDLYRQFQDLLSRTVLYAASTPSLFLGDYPAGFYVRKYSGVSVYIWQDAHATLNETYVTLDWYKKVFH